MNCNVIYECDVRQYGLWLLLHANTSNCYLIVCHRDTKKTPNNLLSAFDLGADEFLYD